MEIIKPKKKGKKMMDGINFFLIVMLYFAVFMKNIEHEKLWYFHKHSNEEEGKRFREYLGEDKK